MWWEKYSSEDIKGNEEKSEKQTSWAEISFSINKESKHLLKEISLIIVLFILFVFIAFYIVAHRFDNADVLLMNTLLQIRNNLSSFWDKLFVLLTVLGDWRAIFVLTLAFLMYFLFTFRVRELLFLCVSLFLGFASQSLFKIGIQRSRPGAYYALLNQGGFSFPSGHAVAGIVFYGFLFYVLFVNLRNKALKIPTAILALLVSLGIGFSRFYLGVHWLFDVIGGWLWGSIVLIFAIMLMEKAVREEFLGRLNLVPHLLKAKYIFLTLFFVAAIILVYSLYLEHISTLKIKELQLKATSKIVLAEEQISYREVLNLPSFPKEANILATQNKYPFSLVILSNNDELMKLFKVNGWESVSLNYWKNFVFVRVVNENGFILPLTLDARLPSFIFKNKGCIEDYWCFAYVWNTNFGYQDKDFFVVAFSLDSFLLKNKPKGMEDIAYIREAIASTFSRSGNIAYVEELKIAKPYLVDVYGKKLLYDGQVYFLKTNH